MNKIICGVDVSKRWLDAHVEEAAAVSVRVAHPARGGRKIAQVLAREGIGTPAASTITGLLRRNGIELGALGGGAQPFIRFEHAAPNHLWQMDFKVYVALRAESGAD